MKNKQEKPSKPNVGGLLEVLGAKTMPEYHYVSIFIGNGSTLFSVAHFCELVCNFFVLGRFHLYRDALEYAKKIAKEGNLEIKDEIPEGDKE